jgi:hypothetical protein
VITTGSIVDSLIKITNRRCPTKRVFPYQSPSSVVEGGGSAGAVTFSVDNSF